MSFMKKLNSMVYRLDEHINGAYPPPPPSRAERVKETAEIIKENSISCHCGGLAIPLMYSGRTYKCMRCDKQFANAKYDLRSLSTVNLKRGNTFNEKEVEAHNAMNSMKNFREDAVTLLLEEDQNRVS